MRSQYIKLFIYNYLYLLGLEFIFKIAVLKTYDMGFFYILLFSLPIAVFITFISSLSKKRSINRFVSILLWVILLFIAGAEAVYYSFYRTICGFSALMYGGQVAEFADQIMIHIKGNALVIITYISLCVLLIVLSATKRITHDRFVLKETLALFIGTWFLGMTSLELHIEDMEPAKNLYFKTNDLMQSTNTFGMNSAVLLDAIKLVGHFEESIELPKETRTYEKEEAVLYNVTDIDFEKLMENEKDKTVKGMHAYFLGSEPSKQNKYTGLFAGKNLIFIVAEGFYPIAVDEEITPTLYKLVNNGFVFNHYYQPIYNCSTSDGEFINSLSILPGVATCSMKSTSDVYLPYALGNIMKNYGYKANAFHGWTYTYYDRHKTMPNLGYTYYGYDRYRRGYKYALKNINDSWPTSDIDVINASYPIYSKESPFVSYYMSISGHLQYNFSGGNAMSSKNKDVVKDMKASETIKAYMASQVEFDRSLKILLDNLEKDGILDDTVIVVSADHYPYGLTNKDIRGYVDWMKDENFDLYQNNLILYNSKLPKIEVDKYTSSLDVLPTLLNLFGVEYDSRLLIGRDIFSDSKDLVIFNNKSWITDKGRYNYLKKKFEPFEGVSVSDDYVSEMNEIVKLKFQMSKLLIQKDYYRKVLGGK